MIICHPRQGRRAARRRPRRALLYPHRQRQDDRVYPLGKATKQRLTDIQIHLQGLTTFAVDHEILV